MKLVSVIYVDMYLYMYMFIYIGLPWWLKW